jgi:hypothetical protein
MAMVKIIIPTKPTITNLPMKRPLKLTNSMMKERGP